MHIYLSDISVLCQVIGLIFSTARVTSREAIEQLFFAAPFMKHFYGRHLEKAYDALVALRTAFVTTLPDSPDDKLPTFPDRVNQVRLYL